MAVEQKAYPHPHVNDAWIARLREDVLEPESADHRRAPSYVGARVGRLSAAATESRRHRRS